MKYRRLGNTGLEVSAICLGCMTYGDPDWRPWILDESVAHEHFKVALDNGINFFDTADMYSVGRSEEITGKLLRELAARDDYVLATKVFFPMADGPNRAGLSRKHILAACDDSLRRLGLDYIDLYQIHRWDFETPIEETVEALDSLVRAGKVRYLGASSMAAWQLSKALYTADAQGCHRFVSMQNHYNLAYREEEREIIPLCIDQGIGLISWSPLARGLLTGSRTRQDRSATTRGANDPFADQWYSRDEDFDVVDTLLALSHERGESAAALALAWLLSVPGVTAPIVGATQAKHLEEACAATELTLTDEEIERLEAPYVPNTIRGHDQPSPREMG